jgi:hypothetical protein
MLITQLRRFTKNLLHSRTHGNVCITHQGVVYQEAVSAGTCLPSLCLAMNVSSGSTFRLSADVSQHLQLSVYQDVQLICEPPF